MAFCSAHGINIYEQFPHTLWSVNVTFV